MKNKLEKALCGFMINPHNTHMDFDVGPDMIKTFCFLSKKTIDFSDNVADAEVNNNEIILNPVWVDSSTIFTINKVLYDKTYPLMSGFQFPIANEDNPSQFDLASISRDAKSLNFKAIIGGENVSIANVTEPVERLFVILQIAHLFAEFIDAGKIDNVAANYINFSKQFSLAENFFAIRVGLGLSRMVAHNLDEHHITKNLLMSIKEAVDG